MVHHADLFDTTSAFQLPSTSAPKSSSPTPLLSSPKDLLIQIIATVPSEEIWKSLGLDRTESNSNLDSNETISALEKAAFEINRLRNSLRGLVELRDDET